MKDNHTRCLEKPGTFSLFTLVYNRNLDTEVNTMKDLIKENEELKKELTEAKIAAIGAVDKAIEYQKSLMRIYYFLKDYHPDVWKEYQTMLNAKIDE